MKSLEQLEQLLADSKVEAQAFYEKGNASAGTRARNGLLAIKKLCDEIRKDITEVKNKRAEAKKK